LDQQILIIILGTALVTYLPRMLPLVVLSRVQLRGAFLRWLQFVPAAVLAALLAPGLLLPDGQLVLTGNPYLLAAIFTSIVLQIAAIYMPFLQRALGTAPLAPADWGIIVLVTSSIFFVDEIRKYVQRRLETNREGYASL